MNQEWIDATTKLPEVKRFGLSRRRESEVMLVWVGENDYSERETTTAYYDGDNSEWVYLEENFSAYPVKKWRHLPSSPNS